MWELRKKTCQWTNQIWHNWYLISLHSNISYKNRSGNFRRILEGMKIKDLRKLSSNTTDELKICDNTYKRWCELMVDLFFTKLFTTDKKLRTQRLSFAISVFFHQKWFDYINLNSIPHLDIVKNPFPNKLNTDEPPSVVCSLGKTIRSNILSYKETVSSIDKNDDITYDTIIVECHCQ